MEKNFGQVRNGANINEDYAFASGQQIIDIDNLIASKRAQIDALYSQAQDLEASGHDWIQDAIKTSPCKGSSSKKNDCNAENARKTALGQSNLNLASEKRASASSILAEIEGENGLIAQKQKLIDQQVSSDNIASIAEAEAVKNLANQGLTKDSAQVLAQAQAQTMVNQQVSASKSKQRLIISLIIVGVAITLIVVVVKVKSKAKQQIG